MWKESKDHNFKPKSPPLGKSPIDQLKEQSVIGPSIIIKGEIAGEEDLTIQGRVEGTIDLRQNNITIVRNGCVKADICGKVISIEGEVLGDLFGEERIVVRGGGVVRGNLRAPRVNLEDGAKFSGNIDMEFESGEKRPTLKAAQVLSNQASSLQKETSKKGYPADPSKPNGSGVSSELVSEKPRL